MEKITYYLLRFDALVNSFIREEKVVFEDEEFRFYELFCFNE